MSRSLVKRQIKKGDTRPPMPLAEALTRMSAAARSFKLEIRQDFGYCLDRGWGGRQRIVWVFILPDAELHEIMVTRDAHSINFKTVRVGA